jgi:hypothetical protein
LMFLASNFQKSDSENPCSKFEIGLSLSPKLSNRALKTLSPKP